MRKIALLLPALLLSINGYALKSIKITASAGNPIPTTYGTGLHSRLLSDIPGRFNHLYVYNDSSSNVACSVKNTDVSTVTPDVTASEEIFIPDGVGIALDDIGISKNVFCRSDSGSAITSGNLTVTVW